MKAIGSIAEYKPFTKGLFYHLNTIKEKYPEHAIIVVLNGNFTQRGDVSILDKWKRTEIALKCGADLVIELPFPFATQSADFFAYGGVTILEHLQAEKLIFGSESDSIEDLKEIANIQVNNEDLDHLVKVYSKLGSNYPTALSNAIYDLTGKKINTPNDLLGISYIKTIIQNNYSIIPESIQRTTNYHTSIESASQIREQLKEGKDVNDYIPELELEYMNHFHFLEDYFDLLKYKILSEEDLSIYQTVEEGIEHALKREIETCNTIDELLERIKSKRYTHNKLKRMLIHILCNFTKEKAKQMNQISYIRILGFNDKGKEYLNKIKKEITIPIISKITREKDPMLEYEFNTTKIYDLPQKENLIQKEYKRY